MRIISALLYISETKIASSSKMASLICWIVYFVVFVIAQGCAVMTLNSKNTLDKDLPLQTYVVKTVLVECIIWDCLLLPVFMAACASKSGAFRKLFPALSAIRFVANSDKEI
jgi:hypothetical protein